MNAVKEDVRAIQRQYRQRSINYKYCFSFNLSFYILAMINRICLFIFYLSSWFSLHVAKG